MYVHALWRRQTRPQHPPFSCCLRASEKPDNSPCSLEQARLEWTGSMPGIPAPLCAPCCPTCVKRRQMIGGGAASLLLLAQAGPKGLWKRTQAGQVRLGEGGWDQTHRNHQETSAVPSFSSFSLSCAGSSPPDCTGNRKPCRGSSTKNRSVRFSSSSFPSSQAPAP